jgi:galactose mutarotase-like enzyme
LWSTVWTSSVYDHAGGTTLAGTARGTLLPYEFRREITVEAHEPTVRFRYRLTHTGDAPFPWVWSSHPLFTVQPGTVLELPTVSQVKLDAVHGRDDLARGDVVSWSGAIGGVGADFTFPERSERGWAVKLFGDVGGSGRMALVDPHHGERLEILVRPDEVPQVGVWINCDGWAPDGRRPYYNLALEPCIGAPDRLDDAVLDWKLAQTLAPGEERTWTVDVHLPGD